MGKIDIAIIAALVALVFVQGLYLMGLSDQPQLSPAEQLRAGSTVFFYMAVSVLIALTVVVLFLIKMNHHKEELPSLN